MILGFKDFVFESFKKAYGQTEKAREYFNKLKKGDTLKYAGDSVKIIDISKSDGAVYTITVRNEKREKEWNINFRQFVSDVAIPEDHK